jgi:hypothetical protein
MSRVLMSLLSTFLLRSRKSALIKSLCLRATGPVNQRAGQKQKWHKIFNCRREKYETILPPYVPAVPVACDVLLGAKFLQLCK